MTHKLTWLAILLTFLLTIPCLFIGGIAALLYHYILAPMFDGNLVNWATGGWFEKLTMAVLPNVLHGGIAGGLALFICAKILRSANYEIVAYTVSGIVLVFAIFSGLFGITNAGLDLTIVELSANTAGILIGLFIARNAVEGEQRSRFEKASIAR